MDVAPKINEDVFGTKVFSVIFTIRDSGNTVDRTDAGYLEVTSNGGATITGNQTNVLTIEGSQVQCNTAMENLNYVPSADFEDNVGVSYAQSDDNNSGTPGSNPFNDFMEINVRNTHDEFLVNSAVTYDEDTVSLCDLGDITDLRPDNIDPDIEYTITLTIDQADGIVEPILWTDEGAGVYSFTGLKDDCNNALANVRLIPGADNVSQIQVSYSQNQDTDNIAQVSTVIGINVDETHDDFNIITDFEYKQNYINSVNLGEITDLRPDNIDPSIEYTCDFVITDPFEGQFYSRTDTVINTNSIYDSIVSCSEDGKYVLLIDGTTATESRLYEDIDGTYTLIQTFVGGARLARNAPVVVNVNEDDVEIYEKVDGTWQITYSSAKITSFFTGDAMDITDDGTMVIICQPTSGGSFDPHSLVKDLDTDTWIRYELPELPNQTLPVDVTFAHPVTQQDATRAELLYKSTTNDQWFTDIIQWIDSSKSWYSPSGRTLVDRIGGYIPYSIYRYDNVMAWFATNTRINMSYNTNPNFYYSVDAPNNRNRHVMLVTSDLVVILNDGYIPTTGDNAYTFIPVDFSSEFYIVDESGDFNGFSTNPQGLFKFIHDLHFTTNGSVTANKTKMNQILNNFVYSSSDTFSSNFELNYTQTQITDSVDQGSTVVTAIYDGTVVAPTWTASPFGLNGGITTPGYDGRIDRLRCNRDTNKWISIQDTENSSYSEDDGITWTPFSMGGTFMSIAFDIGYNGNTWVCVGESGIAKRSIDNGVTWTDLPNALGNTSALATGSSYIYSVRGQSNGTWIVGFRTGAASRSTDDGATWTDLPDYLNTSASNNEDINEIVSDGNGVWIGVLNGGYISRSTDDGATWTEITSFTTRNLESVATNGNGLWYVGSLNRGFWYSINNGATWTADITLNALVLYNKRIACYGNSWVVAGRHVDVAYSGNNGTTWELLPEHLNNGGSSTVAYFYGLDCNTNGIWMSGNQDGYASRGVQ